MSTLALVCLCDVALPPPPLLLAELACAVCKDSANRWTDNCLNMLSWAKKKWEGKEVELCALWSEVRYWARGHAIMHHAAAPGLAGWACSM